jgi:hypothetical protein
MPFVAALRRIPTPYRTAIETLRLPALIWNSNAYWAGAEARIPLIELFLSYRKATDETYDNDAVNRIRRELLVASSENRLTNRLPPIWAAGLANRVSGIRKTMGL